MAEIEMVCVCYLISLGVFVQLCNEKGFGFVIRDISLYLFLFYCHITQLLFMPT